MGTEAVSIWKRHERRLRDLWDQVRTPQNYRKWLSQAWDWITKEPITVYTALLAGCMLLVGVLGWVSVYGEKNVGWFGGLVTEAHGMLFDILVLGVVFSWINGRGEKRRKIERYKEEIDDFRGWNSDEAAHRIWGNVKRLQRLGVRVNKLNLWGCCLKNLNMQGADLEGARLGVAYLNSAYLEGANLKWANLEGADLRGAHLEGTNLEGARLGGADLRGARLGEADLKGAFLNRADLRGAYLAGAYLIGAYLKGAIGLSFEQLKDVDTLFDVRGLGDELKDRLETERPELFRYPRERESQESGE